MQGFKVRKLEDTEYISYGAQSDLRVLLGDDDKSTPIRVALQTCQPGYKVPVHCHPYVEYLIVLAGSATFRIEQDGILEVSIGKGESVEMHAQVWHSFATSETEVTQLMGIHISPERIVNYKPGVKTDARGFRVED